ncbi:MAG: hypothetical protein PUA73_03290 [Bacilli bacterium]|nr:hypothetical protein [Bacilli bacterium]
MENINKKELIIITDNGKYTALGNTEDYKTHHIDCLIEYAFYNTNFKTTESDDSKLFHKIIYYLIIKGDAVYLHSQGYGLLYMPSIPTGKQIDTLYKIFSQLQPTTIYTNYDIKMNKQGQITGSMVNGEENTKAIDSYLDETKSKKSNQPKILKKRMIKDDNQ